MKHLIKILIFSFALLNSEMYDLIKSNDAEHLITIGGGELEAGGFEVGSIQIRLLEKIEEQALYIIDLQKQIDE